MAHLMKNIEAPPESRWQKGKFMLPVKREVELESSSDEEHFSMINKRSKLSSYQQQLSVGAGGFPVTPLQHSSLDEPSPLGLRLRKSPSLLDLIQMRLTQGNSSNVGNHGKKELKGSTGMTEKLKASNFPASVLKIGSWEYKSKHEGDLVAKCYFAKHKLVWEVLDGGLKNKIEIQWSDIMGLKANYPDDRPGTLDVVLARQPLFFRETNPQPRKHTLWQATSDFTEGQASKNRQHYLECPPGFLGKHFDKLMQCDPRLNFLSQQAEITVDSPHFESRISVFEDPRVAEPEFDICNDDSPKISNLQSATSPSGAHSSSFKSELDPVSRSTQHIHPEKTTPNSGATEDIKSRQVELMKGLNNLNQLRVPGIHSSMSMSKLVNCLEQRVSEQKTSKPISLASEKRKNLDILEEISRLLLSDTQNVPASDEKSLMSRVNSLCCLLQKDPATAQKSENYGDPFTPEYESVDLSDCKPIPTMSRKDSVGDLLLNLPRIASLPQFLFNICDGSGNEAR